MDLVIGLTITGVAVPIGNNIIASSHKTYNVQAQVKEMDKNIRNVCDMITQDLRTAGSRPLQNGARDVGNSAAILQINVSSADTVAATITYAYSADIKGIIRTCHGVSESVAENIQDFSFTFLDSQDAIIATADSQGSICKVEFVIVGRTARPDAHFAQNAGYRTESLTSTMALRNML
ncbi:MAG: hypothetical protein PHC61_11925 [Chitinivibrionales bacterium]|nr:hypothetical protein [Chitinivibrionales bacterium]